MGPRPRLPACVFCSRHYFILLLLLCMVIYCIAWYKVPLRGVASGVGVYLPGISYGSTGSSSSGQGEFEGFTATTLLTCSVHVCVDAQATHTYLVYCFTRRTILQELRQGIPT